MHINTRRTLGDRAFPVAAAQVWNSLPTTSTDFTVITANVQAAAQDIPVRAVVFVILLLHYLRHDFFTLTFWHCNVSLKFT